MWTYDMMTPQTDNVKYMSTQIVLLELMYILEQ